MDIGIQSNLWGTEQHGESLPSILAEIAEAGYAGIEIGAHRFDNLDHPEVFFEMVKQNNLHVSGIHTIGKFYFDGNLDYLEKAARFTRAVECDYLLVSGDSKKNKSRSDIKKITNVLNEAGEICKGYGIAYCYHNHAFEFEGGGEEFRALCDLTNPDLVHLCLDIGWVERSGTSPYEVAKEYRNRIRYLHLKDTLDGKFVNLGEGTVDLPAVIDLLVGNKDIYFTVELDELVPNSLESAKKCRSYLKEMGL